MTLKVYIDPHYSKADKADGGIRRVVEAMVKYLPDFEVKPTRDIRKADVLAGHGAIWFDQSERPFISHNHGMYWGEYEWAEGEYQTNKAVTEALVRAQAVTVPSQWVRSALTRGMLVEPEVIYHGVDADEWQHGYDTEGYVLWNKARQDPVSDPSDMQKLAALMPAYRFVSTLGNATKNVKLCGVMPLPKMQPIIQKAGVYLATARETFGIGTLEALASGVPVAGWRYGGQAEIIIDGETGYLAEYGDYPGLVGCVRKCLDRRQELSRNAVADVRERWQWPDKIERYAKLYQRVYAEWHAERPQVTVIVTCYNLAKFLPDALKSVQAQTFSEWECLVVDDGSKDNTKAVADQFIESDKRVRYLQTPWNLGLSGARNFGIAKARGKYIINLDADDMLTEKTLSLLVNALEGHAELAIAYGRLDTMAEDGTNRQSNAFPSGDYNWQGQMSHLNQLHYSALMRREVWERSGGYREKMWRAEDAEFWCRVTSFGFRAAMVTEEPTLIWRIRRNSKSQIERQNYIDLDGYWNEGFPWHQAKTGQEGTELVRKNGKVLPHLELVPFSAQGEPPEGKRWSPWHRQEPVISVIIPVGPGHQRYALDALDCLTAQTFGRWEAVVVNDSGELLDKIPGAPYARIIQTEGKRGAGYARNRGMEAARGQLVFFLDADDLIAPDTLLKMLRAYAASNAGYVYSGWQLEQANHQFKIFKANPYDQRGWLDHGQHAVTVLMAKEDAQRIGGFDENLPGWEDWDFFAKCAVNGICGVAVPEPLLIYRYWTGQRTKTAFGQERELKQELAARFKEYATGSKEMAKCCGGNTAAVQAVKGLREAMEARAHGNGRVEVPDSVPDGYVRMQFIGPQRGPVTYYVNGHPYVGANDDRHRFVNVRAEDATRLGMLEVWRKVRVQAPPPVPEPEPVTVTQPEPVPAPIAAVAELPKPVMPPHPDIIREPVPPPVVRKPARKRQRV